jgi:DNA polymerase zeta
VRCDSGDCPVFYTRLRERAILAGLRDGIGNIVEVLEEDEKLVETKMNLDW